MYLEGTTRWLVQRRQPLAQQVLGNEMGAKIDVFYLMQVITPQLPRR
jgi:hypothetical protein